MSYALRTASGPVELSPGQPIVLADVQFSYGTMGLWSDAERAAHGIARIVEPDAVPAGKTSTGSTLADDGTMIRRVLTLVDAPPEPLPDISDRQCFEQLAILGKVTQDEALAAVTVGALPKAVSDGIAQLPADQQFAAKMLVCGATSFHHDHPLVPVFFSFVGIIGSADVDAFWRAAGLL